MNLNNIKNHSLNILKDFINYIGLDGEYYISLCDCPILFGITDLNCVGEYISPDSEKISIILDSLESDTQINKVKHRGLILINEEFKKDPFNPDLYITIIHEIIHSNRNILIYDLIKKKFSNVDASQDILKGDIKDNYNIDDLMYNQYKIDEALVELMAILAYKLYNNKIHGKSLDIWQILFETRDYFKGEDISIMCDIILKHRDLELFYWMIDPIFYSFGDIHYDFFSEYTKNDKELLDRFFCSNTKCLKFYKT